MSGSMVEKTAHLMVTRKQVEDREKEKERKEEKKKWWGEDQSPLM